MMSSEGDAKESRSRNAALLDDHSGASNAGPEDESAEVELSRESLVPETDDGDREDQDFFVLPNVQVHRAPKLRLRDAVLPVGVFTLALLARLYVLFFLTDPQNAAFGWYGDVYHHWQVAYLSKEVGFTYGFLRLWDFKGLEFFWGLLHPLVLIGLFQLTGSVDIVIPRLLSAFFGSLSVVFIVLLLKRHFNLGVAIAGGLLAGFNPIAVFSDSIGMQEPLGLALLLGGLLLLPRQPLLSGLLWALGGMVRAEYWVFGAGLLVAAVFTRLFKKQTVPLLIGWGVPSLLYMKYMLDHTGNPIYPVYWNFLAGTAGRWMQDVVLNAEQLTAQLVARVVLLVALVFAGWILWKRPRSALFLLLGLGNIVMIGIVLGLGKYINGYITRVLVDRLLAVPYGYVGIFVAIVALYVLPKHVPRAAGLTAGWSSTLLVFGAAQLAWAPLLGYYEPLRPLWEAEMELADQVEFYYHGGTISIPEDRQALTYGLVRFQGIEGKDLEGQMYDPFSYIEGDPFQDWERNRQLVWQWLTDHNITLLVFYDGKPEYEEMIKREPTWFDYETSAYRRTIDIYQVHPGDLND
jgi:hypothetical protein